jgi:adenosylcobinamide kinase/adenosylcobinamide-phosphate guanylyltransferase
MITLVIGGARCGQSRHAETLAGESGKAKLYIATAEAFDAEMQTRIAHHRAERADAQWQTIEEPLAIANIITDAAFANHVVMVECLTVWLGNLMHYKHDITDATGALVQALGTSKADIILVANEVGGGLVPESPMAREFRDAAGILHQQVAAIAQRVVLMVAGLPLAVKG